MLLLYHSQNQYVLYMNNHLEMEIFYHQGIHMIDYLYRPDKTNQHQVYFLLVLLLLNHLSNQYDLFLN